MSERGKQIGKKVWRAILPGLISIPVTVFLFYLLHGFPIMGNLKGRQDIVKVTVVQEGQSVILTEEEDMRRAAQFASLLNVYFPQNGEGSPQTLYLFSFEDGSTKEIGTDGEAVFYNGKRYLGAGDNEALLYNITEGFFFPEKALEKSESE